MQELRFVAVSEDGSYAVLAVPGRSARYTLPIDERLRAVALGQTSRLAQYEIEVESPLRPKEIQARIRAGETAEEIADAAGIPVERVRWFEGPVLAERAYVANQAQAASVRRVGDSAGPGPRLGDIVPERLSAAGADPEDGQWDSRKRGDGSWQVQLTFAAGGRLHIAEWIFDPRRRHVMPDDDNAARLSLPESELPPLSVPVPGEATVTPLAPRLGAAAGMGAGLGSGPVGGLGGGPPSGRFRPERGPAPERPAMSHAPAVPQPQVTAPASVHDSERTRLAPQHPPIPAPERDASRAHPEAGHDQRSPESMATVTSPAPPAAPRPAPAAGERATASPVTEQPASARHTAEPVAAESAAATPVAAEPADLAAEVSPVSPEPADASAEEQAARSRPGKKNARGRRSSVPSWDEIMLGSSRQRD